ncbi:MAG: ABC-F family ATP-binding cassette domain-containing protein [Clostridia bacterium]|nr:ABC-F family ATP-binding cassette domain-containing protein [Clostridia bacterium]MBQ9995124.1 ABC-F family ATP-binding cassette domain-containing protein [Clostridia bacterium]
MISISTRSLAYRIGTRDILTDVTFSLEEGDRLAVVGVNGSGKSTLLRMLCGEYTPDEGEVYIAKEKVIGMLHQDDAFNVLSLDSANTIVDETVLGQIYAIFPDLCRAEMKLADLQRQLDEAPSDDTALLSRLSSEYESVNTRYIDGGGLHYKSRCRSILKDLGFGEEMFDMPVSKCSGGQRTRLALARLLSREPDILILDEPTNHLDTETMEWLESHLASYNPKKTIILVSHDRLFLDRVTNKTLDIEHTVGKLYKCGYSQYVIEKEAYRREWEKKYEIQQKEIARLEAYIEQQRRWNRERNIIAAESREKAIARMEKIEKPKDLPKSIRFALSSSGESGNDVAYARKLTMGFGNNILFRDLNFLVKKHDRLFISGPNGCGKSTLIKLLLGQLEPISGEIEFGYNVTVGYYDQENQNLDENNTVLDELWNAYPNLTQTEIRNTLALFLFRGDDIEKEVSVLSGGERARLTLAKLILSKMNLLILDEPTNHLDIESREALENALLSFDGTIIAVSHDRYFTKRLATRFVDLGENGRDFRGTYDEYLLYKQNRAAEVENFAKYVPEESTQKEEYIERKKKGAEIRRIEKRKAEVAREIKKLEQQLIDIDDELFGDAASDYVRAAELTDLKTTTEDRLMQLYAEEEELNEG